MKTQQTTKAKQLLVFAHRGEAQVFLNYGRFCKTNGNIKRLYENGQKLLLITGEGVALAAERLNEVCLVFQNQIDNVINYGIAAGLCSVCQKDHIYRIRTVHVEATDDEKFPSVRSADLNAEFDCITAKKRVLTPEYGQKLTAKAPIVDRELWGYATVCKTYGLPFYAYKLISDCIGEQVFLENIKNKATAYSRQLFEFNERFVKE